MYLPHLEKLGPRICILGPSNSGKSTLARAIAVKQNLPLIHLDQLFHYPNTNWQPRPFEEFEMLHQTAIAGDQWIIEGNYTKTLPARLASATGIILLDSSTIMSLMRYFHRTWFQQNRRIGSLAGNQDSIKWNMLRHITIVTPKNRRRYQTIYANILLPKCFIPCRSKLNQAYQKWGLSFPK